MSPCNTLIQTNEDEIQRIASNKINECSIVTKNPIKSGAAYSMVACALLFNPWKSWIVKVIQIVMNYNNKTHSQSRGAIFNLVDCPCIWNNFFLIFS